MWGRFLIILTMLSTQMIASEDAGPFVLWREHDLKFTTPLTWSITRSDPSANTMSSQTETFREQWHLELLKGTDAFLVSPRARVPVELGSYTKDVPAVPRIVFLSDNDLAKLLGIPSDDAPLETQADSGDIIPLTIAGLRTQATQTFTLKLSKDLFCSVEITLGS